MPTSTMTGCSCSWSSSNSRSTTASTRSSRRSRVAASSLAAIVLAGCSSLGKVSEHANEIRTEARLLEAHGRETGDAQVVDSSRRIYDLAAHIHERLPDLEDKEPAWLSTLVWVSAAVVAVAVVVLLWQTGLGQAIRVAVGWLPRKKVSDAELAFSMLRPESKEDPREYVAARRGADPEFDAAWRRLSKKEAHVPDSR